MNTENCRHEIVARGAVGHVAMCHACGQVHLSLEYMTLRFESGAFRALANMVAQALHHIGDGSPRAAAILAVLADESIH